MPYITQQHTFDGLNVPLTTFDGRILVEVPTAEKRRDIVETYNIQPSPNVNKSYTEFGIIADPADPAQKGVAPVKGTIIMYHSKPGNRVMRADSDSKTETEFELVYPTSILAYIPQSANSDK